MQPIQDIWGCDITEEEVIHRLSFHRDWIVQKIKEIMESDKLMRKLSAFYAGKVIIVTRNFSAKVSSLFPSSDDDFINWMDYEERAKMVCHVFDLFPNKQLVG